MARRSSHLSRASTSRDGIGTCVARLVDEPCGGCRGFIGPFPLPLWMRYSVVSPSVTDDLAGPSCREDHEPRDHVTDYGRPRHRLGDDPFAPGARPRLGALADRLPAAARGPLLCTPGPPRPLRPLGPEPAPATRGPGRRTAGRRGGDLRLAPRSPAASRRGVRPHPTEAAPPAGQPARAACLHPGPASQPGRPGRGDARARRRRPCGGSARRPAPRRPSRRRWPTARPHHVVGLDRRGQQPQPGVAVVGRQEVAQMRPAP